MENDEKIFEKIKHASLLPEAEDFPSMDKVWQRVESKLDNKVLKKENRLWKKIAVAASFLLVFTLSYQVFKPTETALELPIAKPQPQTTRDMNVVPNATENSVASEQNQQSDAIVSTAAASKPAKMASPEAETKSESVAANESIGEKISGYSEADESPKAASPVLKTEATVAKDTKDAADENLRHGEFNGQIFDARSVKREEAAYAKAKKSKEQPTQKSVPLMVIDGKAVTAKTDQQALRDGLSHVDPDDVANIVVLDEPLYIINGHQYSEQELFGPKPTSPYHPLGEQQIESLVILQGEKAVAAYGKKGQKGVVIISTKNSKPANAPAHKE